MQTIRISPIVNSLLSVIFLAVLASVAIMIVSTGYNDEVSHTCFRLLGTSGILLMARLFFQVEENEGEQAQ